MLSFRKIYYTLILISVITSNAFGKKYDVSEIPPSLKSNAKAVIRTYSEVFERTGMNSGNRKIHYAITVLNKGGLSAAIFFQVYNKYSRVNNISAIIYDKNGNQVKKIKKDEIKDFAIDFLLSIFSDTRAKVFVPHYQNYPFTIEYSCTINYKSLMQIPYWDIYHNYNTSVQHESFKIIFPDNPELEIKYFTNDDTLKLTKTTEKHKIIYSLELNNLFPIENEMYTTPQNILEHSVFFAPLNFTISGFKGSYSDWATFGNFIANLNKGRDELSEKSKNKITNLVSGETDKHRIVEILYEYMQNKVRYVSIQKGLGGWQPFEAQKVDDLSYGDCKALTNYMKSLLKVAGIEAKYTLVKAGEKKYPLIKDFPSNQFNHAILCVPLNHDTVWLECTDQHIPCGYLGSFTDDRYVLVIDDNNKSKIVRTPAYDKNENKRTRTIDVFINANGNCNMKITEKSRGLFYDKMRNVLFNTRENQKKKILEQLHFSTVNLKDFEFSKETTANIPEFSLNMDIEVKHYATFSGNNIIFNIYPFYQNEFKYVSNKTRTAPIFIQRNYSTVDSVVFHIPEEYVVSVNLKQNNINSLFGTYSVNLVKQSGKIIFIRKKTIKKGTYPLTKNDQLISFFNKITKTDNTKAVLIKTR